MACEDANKTNVAADRVRDIITKLARDGSVVANLDGTSHNIFPVALSPEEAEGLKKWVVAEDATQTIEIGLGYGVSALHICEGLLLNGNARARHTVIDPSQSTRFGDCGLQVLEEAGVKDLLEYHKEWSEFALPSFLKQGRTFDLAFVDGNHRFDSVFVDLFYLGRLLRKGGIVILDDYNLPGIKRAVSFLVMNLRWTIEETFPPNDHSVVVRTAVQEDRRHFRDFVEF